MRIPSKSGIPNSMQSVELFTASDGYASLLPLSGGYYRNVSAYSIDKLQLLIRRIDSARSASDIVGLGYFPAFSEGATDMGVYIDVVNDYGADNTGVTETSAQIMQAYNSSSNGSCLYFRPGTYKINPNVLNFMSTTHRFKGEPGQTTFKANSKGHDPATAVATLAADIISTSATTITVVDASGLPATPNFQLRLNAGQINDETVFVTGISGTTLTVIRGLNNSTKATHTAGELMDIDGSFMIQFTVSSAFEDILVDCKVGATTDRVSDGIVLGYGASGSLMKGVITQYASRYGCYNEQGWCNFEYCNSRFNFIGFYQYKPNGSVYVGCNATNNESWGFWFTGYNIGKAHGEATNQSGACYLLGCSVDANNSILTDGQVYIQGSFGLYWEGGYWEGGTRMLLIDNKAQTCIIKGIRCAAQGTTSAPYVVEIREARMCEFDFMCAQPLSSMYRQWVGEAGSTNYLSYGNRCTGKAEIGSWNSGLNEYAGIVLEDNASNTYAYGTDNDGCKIALLAPTIGLWHIGDFIRNSAATGPFGWRCTASGFPGTWAAITSA